MSHQLDFWPAAQEAPYGQRYWETLSIEEQIERITMLARLIAKTVCPEIFANVEEASDEP